MAKLYGLGAAVVILGALFKNYSITGSKLNAYRRYDYRIHHFCVLAFEPLHVDYNWALVYPELAMGLDEENSKKDKKKLPTGTPTQQLDKC
jgi:hypothetical protein